MKVSYNRLWKLMIDKKMKNSELQKKAQISGNIITRLNKEEFVSYGNNCKNMRRA